LEAPLPGHLVPTSILSRADDIARQFAHLSPADGAAAVSTHLSRFWEPRMLTELVTRVQAGEPVDPLVVSALATISG